MPSFDLISKIDLMELKNAITLSEKIINGRFDFKGSEAKAEYKEKDNLIEIKAENEMRVKTVLDILRSNMGKRGISVKGMEESKIESSGLNMKKMTLKLTTGITKDNHKTISNLIKEFGFKGKAQYMDEKYRIESKSIDELQEVFNFLKNHKDVNCDLQMENLKR